MTGYLYGVTETHPPQDLAVPESDADRRERESERLDVAPTRPGDDPPTYGDEGGGSLYPEASMGKPLEVRPPFFRRLLGG
jgi:hypothetical protein